MNRGRRSVETLNRPEASRTGVPVRILALVVGVGLAVVAGCAPKAAAPTAGTPATAP